MQLRQNAGYLLFYAKIAVHASSEVHSQIPRFGHTSPDKKLGNVAGHLLNIWIGETERIEIFRI